MTELSRKQFLTALGYGGIMAGLTGRTAFSSDTSTVTSADASRTIAIMGGDPAFYQPYVAPDIHIVAAPHSPGSVKRGFIDSHSEEAIEALEVMKCAIACEKLGYGAMMVGCTADPGLYAARELVRMPVMGPCESSMLLAASLGHGFVAVTLDKAHVPDIYKRARNVGVEPKLKAVRWVDYHGGKPPLERFVKEVNDAVDKEGAHAVVALCMGWVNYIADLQKQVPIPIVNPGLAAIRHAETLIKLNISHSKQAFPDPILSEETREFLGAVSRTTTSRR
jgi:allantoin racemase